MALKPSIYDFPSITFLPFICLLAYYSLPCLKCQTFFFLLPYICHLLLSFLLLLATSLSLSPSFPRFFQHLFCPFFFPGFRIIRVSLLPVPPWSPHSTTPDTHTRTFIHIPPVSVSLELPEGITSTFKFIFLFLFPFESRSYSLLSFPLCE